MLQFRPRAHDLTLLQIMWAALGSAWVSGVSISQLLRLHMQAKADERVAALEKGNVALKVQATDASQRVEKLEKQLSSCKALLHEHFL